MSVRTALLLSTVACGPHPALTSRDDLPIPSAARASVRAPASAPDASAMQPEAPSPKPGTFSDDLAFLSRHGAVLVLTSASGAKVAVSPRYQGRVMTSAVGAEEASLGFIHRAFIEAGRTGTQFDNYGGEDRFWLGPEGGPFGLYFAPGKPFEMSAWQTPDAFQLGEWKVSEATADHVVLERDLHVANHAGTTFDMRVVRTVKLLDAEAVERSLGVPPPEAARWVAFETQNRITNIGANAWTKKTGLPSVWILGMYRPSPDTFVAIPFDAKAKGEIVNDRYFGKVGDERLRVDEAAGVLLFRCDGAQRGKIGVGPRRARPTLGSYSERERLLTIVGYDPPRGAHDYVNSMWEQQKDPFAGDVVNSYNDGPTEPGKPGLGGFYEIETSSPGAALAPNESLMHVQRTYHFVGDAAALDPLARRALGVSVRQIVIPRP